MNQADIVNLSVRGCAVIAALYDAQDTGKQFGWIDTRPWGYQPRDVILADELGFTGVPVGIQVEDLQTEEIVEFYRGTTIVPRGPNEWEVDFMAWLEAVPWAPGCRAHHGFLSTEATFRLASGKDFAAPQWIAGHSLAAAWAELRAARLRAKCLSFAAPKIGDRAMADYASQAIDLLIRWVDAQDIVPRQPPYMWPLLEYIHPGPADELDSSGQVTPGIKAWHNIHTYWHLIDPTHPVLPAFQPAPPPTAIP